MSEQCSETTPSRPIIRYFGGKWVLAPWIIKHFPKHRIYCEPFGGAGSVLLRKPRSWHEVYNDVDDELVNLFRVARDSGEELARKLELTPFSRIEFNESYQPSDDSIEQARLTVVRAFQGFGSSAHSNITGFRAFVRSTGTSVGKDWSNYPYALRLIIDRLRGVVIENRAALDVMKAQDSEDTLHYVDPPYVPSTRRANIYRHEMTDRDHEELAEFLHGLKGSVALSGYDSTIYSDLYGDWRCFQKKSHADGAKQRTECLWLNYPANQIEMFGTTHS